MAFPILILPSPYIISLHSSYILVAPLSFSKFKKNELIISDSFVSISIAVVFSRVISPFTNATRINSF